MVYEPPDPDPIDPLSGEERRALEAIITVAADPVPAQLLAQLLEVGLDRVEAECGALAAEYEADGRGFVLVRVAGGYRLQSHPEAAAYVERYVLEGQSARLSNAALETLAIVAYKQPLSRAQVASIRGVNVDGVMRTLTQRGLIEEVARDPGPGQAVLYGTTSLFLERLGLDSVDDLPPIAGFVPGADVVEALEHGLRVEDPPPVTDDAGGDAGGDADGPGDHDHAVDPIGQNEAGQGGLGEDDTSGDDTSEDDTTGRESGIEITGVTAVDPDAGPTGGDPEAAVGDAIDLTDLGRVQGWEADLDAAGESGDDDGNP